MLLLDACSQMCPSFRRFPTVFHNSSIFLPYWLATLVSFRETFQEEKLLTMKGSYKSRWVIVIVVVIAAIAAFWFWQSRNDSRSAAPGRRNKRSNRQRVVDVVCVPAH